MPASLIRVQQTCFAMSRRCELAGCNKWAFSGTKHCLKHKEAASKRLSDSLLDAIAIEKLEISEEEGKATRKDVIDRQRRSLLSSTGGEGSFDVFVHTPSGQKIVLVARAQETTNPRFQGKGWGARNQCTPLSALSASVHRNHAQAQSIEATRPPFSHYSPSSAVGLVWNVRNKCYSTPIRKRFA